MENVYIDQTSKTGKGLFAAKDIKKYSVIFEVQGRIRHGRYSPEVSHIGARWLSINYGLWINPKRRHPWRFINHSCKPNCGIKGQNMLVALCDIKEDEQLTLDYAITEADPYWKMKCRCGEKTCRKIIRSIYSLPKSLFDSYMPFVPPFLQKCYALKQPARPKMKV